MRQRSLRRVLVLQWALFAGALLLGLCTLAAVALFVLEDSFIDARLLAAERALAGEREPLPQVQLWRLADFPERQQARLAGLKPGALRELRLDQRRYLHLRALAPDAEGARFLVFEAQDELRVSEGLWRAAPVLALLLLLLLLHAAWLSRRFVGRIETAAGGLLQALERDPGADALRAAADAQPVQEFQRFGHALAEALDARLAALKREEDTLRFLAHELRTPLQSARLAVEAAAGGLAPVAEARLRRALQRLERASAAVLWLGESTPTVEPPPLLPVLRALAEEFAPLAERRGQWILIELEAAPHWPLPQAAVEAVLGNLLVNAIQHGAPGPIHVVAEGAGLVMRNALGDADPAPGFGLGLQLARRLLARIGWGLRLQRSEDGMALWIEPQPVARSAPQGLSFE